MMQVANMYSTPPPNISNQGPISTNTNTNQSFQPLQFKPFKPPDGEFDGKRLRKSVMRKTVDYNSSIVQMLEARIWQRDERDRPALPADVCYASHILPPPAYLTNPINTVVSKFVRSSTNKAKCPIFCLAWTPEGRRLVTGASSGEFTLWNGLTFNFETILQAHESSVRAMVWSHNDQWMVTGDTSGYVKYWQSNMNNVKMFQAHKDPVRGLSFSPSDLKLASGSDDGTVRIWDFFRCQEEKVLIGHGSDVKCVDWHPSKSLLASGSKDNQQPIKLWDPRTGSSLAQLHAHKSTVMDLKWNSNGMWLCSASRDHLLKLFDIRNLSTELQVFRGHKKEASSIAWHPQHEGLFASGGSDGSILFWHVGNDKEVGSIESAHDGIIWDLAWHPLGHLLCSGSNDHSSKFWTRNRPGDKMRDKYNLNTLPPGVVGDDCVDIDDIPVNVTYMPSAAIPGMGPDDKVEAEPEPKGPETIPGLDFDSLAFERFLKKTPYAKPIPKTFQAAWNAAGGLDEDMEEDQSITSWVIVESENLFCKPANNEGDPVITEIGEELPPGSVPLSEIKANAIAYFGFYIPLCEVSGDKIQDSFAFCEEEEAIAEITSDVDFARKLIREKKGLFNPSTNQSDDSKTDTDIKKENFHKSQHQQHQHPPPHHFHPPHQHFNPQQQPHPQQQIHPQQFHKQHPSNEIQFNELIKNNLNPGVEGWTPGPNPNFKRAPGNFGPPVFRPPSNINQAQQNNHGFIRPPLDFRRGGPPPPMGMFPFQDGNIDKRPFNNSNNSNNNNSNNFNNREENAVRGRSHPSDETDTRMRGGFFIEEGRERSRGGRFMDEGRERGRGEGFVDDGEDRGRDYRTDDRTGDRGRQRGRGRGAGRNFNREEEGGGFTDRRRPYNNNNREEDFERGRGGRDQQYHREGRQNYNNDDNRSYNNNRDGNERSYYREENNVEDTEKGGRGWGRGGGAKNFRNRPGREYDDNQEGGRWRERENPENNYQYGEDDGYGGEEHGNWRDRPRRGRGRGYQGGKNRGRGGGGGGSWNDSTQSKW